MGTGYTRNDTGNNIANGNVIDADDLDGEFNAIVAAFDGSTGHSHDGTTGEGPPISVTGPGQEYLSDATALYPKADDTYDLGKVGAEWKDLYVDGTANIDSLVSGSVDINGGSIDGTVIGGSTAAAIDGSTITASVGFVGDLTGNADTATTLAGLTSTVSELNILDGVTATTSELNILDGATVSTSELNILDGVTATTAEINYLDITTLGTSESSKAVTADSNGDVVLSEELTATSYNETFSTVTSSSGTATVDCETGNVFSITLSENTTFTFSNPPTSGTAYGFMLKLIQDSTARTVTWPASVDWASATAPTISTGSGEVDVFVFVTHDGGTTWYGFTAGQDFG